MPFEQKVPAGSTSPHFPNHLALGAGEFPTRGGSFDYENSMSGHAPRALPHDAIPARTHRLMRLQTFSLSDLASAASNGPPLYSLGRPFPSPPSLRRRSRSRMIGDLAAQMNIQTASLHNFPISPNRAAESRTELSGVPVAPTEMHFLALEDLSEGQCIIATPDLLRNLLEQTRNRDHQTRHQSTGDSDPRQSIQSSHHHPNPMSEYQDPKNNDYQDVNSASLVNPELSSSTAVDKTHKELDAASPNSCHNAHESYNQGRGGVLAQVIKELPQDPTHLSRYLRSKSFIREPAAEALASFLLAVFSGGASAQVYLTGNRSVSPSPKGTYATQCIGSGIGVLTAVYVAGGISGGHLNPIVTLSFAVFRKFPWSKVIPYWCAQILGGLVGAVTIQLIYASGLDIYEGGAGIRTFTGPSSTGGFFLSFPAEYMSNIGSFFQEFLDSAIILLFIMAIGDRKNSPPPDGISPIVFMCVVIGVAFSLGSQTSYAMNPAIDIATRIVVSLMGYGNDHWAYRDQYWLWNNWVSNTAGALVGCFLYDFFIYEGNDSPLNRPWSSNWNPSSLVSIFRRKKRHGQKAINGNGDHLV